MLDNGFLFAARNLSRELIHEGMRSCLLRLERLFLGFVLIPEGLAPLLPLGNCVSQSNFSPVLLTCPPLVPRS